MSWGSSSSRYRLSHCPTRVIRSPLSRSHSDFGRPTGCMVRNLTSLKRFPNRPTRSWMKNTEPRESSLIRSPISTRTGARATTPTTAARRLSTRESTSWRRDVWNSREKMTLLGESASSASLLVRRS